MKAIPERFAMSSDNKNLSKMPDKREKCSVLNRVEIERTSFKHTSW